MTDLLEFARFHYFSEWVALSLVVGAILVINRLFWLNSINALFVAQAIFVFNAIPIISGFVDGYLPADRIWHFFVTETILMLSVCGAYAYIVRRGKLAQDEITDFFAGSVPYILITIGLVLAAFTYVVTPQDGTSRIAYQTNYWYSLVKPVGAFVGPVSYFASFVVLMVHNKRVPAYALLIVSVLSNIASGSKGAFIMQALTAFLMVRDLDLTARFRVNRLDLFLGTAGLVSGLVLSLQRLRLDVSDLWDRIMLFGEPTLLTYFAPDPTAACRTLSLLAKMHRGWARMIGDPGALDIDTLFGYAWTIQYVGVNTFTGPNARFSAYLICNFPDSEIIYGLIMTALYFTLVITAIRTCFRQGLFVPVVYAFVVSSITLVGQDFNVLMQDINFMIGLIVLMAILPRLVRQAEVPVTDGSRVL